MVATIPANGPAMPISKSALFVDIGDLILMNAPKVPIGEIIGGAGIKYLLETGGGFDFLERKSGYESGCYS